MKFGFLAILSFALLLCACSDGKETPSTPLLETPTKDMCFSPPLGSTILCQGSGSTKVDRFDWQTHVSDQPFAAIVDLYRLACGAVEPTKATDSVIWRKPKDQPEQIVAVGISGSAALPLSCEKPPLGKTIIVISNRSTL